MAAKIKVSDEEKARRKNLDLPVTKELVYMAHLNNGEYCEMPVINYIEVEKYMPSETVSLEIELSTGERKRILAPFFAHMQKPSFVDDMKKVRDEE